MTERTYLNACSHGLPSRAVLKRMTDHLAHESEVGAVRAMEGCAEELARVRARASALLGVEAGRIGFCAATTPIWTQVLGRLARPGARVVLCGLEWGDHLRQARWMADRIGMTLDIVPAEDAHEAAAWAERLEDDVAVLAVPAVTSIAGHRPPVEQIAALPRPEGTVLLVDAAQAIGRVSMAETLRGCDVVVATTRKWVRAPRQTALFSLSERAEASMGLTVGELEGSIPNVTLRLALGRALEEACARDGSSLALDVVARIEALDARMRDGLRTHRPDLMVREPGVIGTVTVVVPREQRDGLDRRLGRAGIVAKWCDPALEEPMAGHDATCVPLRVSPHSYNAPEDVDVFLEAMTNP